MLLKERNLDAGFDSIKEFIANRFYRWFIFILENILGILSTICHLAVYSGVTTMIYRYWKGRDLLTELNSEYIYSNLFVITITILSIIIIAILKKPKANITNLDSQLKKEMVTIVDDVIENLTEVSPFKKDGNIYYVTTLANAPARLISKVMSLIFKIMRYFAYIIVVAIALYSLYRLGTSLWFIFKSIFNSQPFNWLTLSYPIFQVIPYFALFSIIQELADYEIEKWFKFFKMFAIKKVISN